jgi:hypothetical protein
MLNQHNFSGTETAVPKYAELYCLCTLYKKYGPLCARLNLYLIPEGYVKTYWVHKPTGHSSSPAAKNGNENIILTTNMGAGTAYILSGNFLLYEMVHKQVA